MVSSYFLLYLIGVVEGVELRMKSDFGTLHLLPVARPNQRRSTIDHLTFGSEAGSSISGAVHSSFHFVIWPYLNYSSNIPHVTLAFAGYTHSIGSCILLLQLCTPNSTNILHLMSLGGHSWEKAALTILRG